MLFITLIKIIRNVYTVMSSKKHGLILLGTYLFFCPEHDIYALEMVLLTSITVTYAYLCEQQIANLNVEKK